MKQHLLERRHSNPWYYDETHCCFPLYTLTGQLVGFQRYNPNGCKRSQETPKYFTLAKNKNTAYGVHLLNPKQKVCFLVEGVFDATPLHALGANALAVLSNNPTNLRSWLRSLGYYLVALCEGDAAGKKLASLADTAVFLPDGRDPGDMPDEWFKQLLEEFE